MAGARIDIEVQDEAVIALLQELLSRVANPQPALDDIGLYGVQSTRDRITIQNADDPIAAWEPLTERYLKSARKKSSKGADMVLVQHGFLTSTLAWQADDETVEWGSNRVYAAAQQFGREEINLPARPWLGLTTTDQDAVIDIFQKWLSLDSGS